MREGLKLFLIRKQNHLKLIFKIIFIANTNDLLEILEKEYSKVYNWAEREN